MNKYKILNRYIKGRDEWNKWAIGLLDRKEKLKKAGKWKVTHGLNNNGRVITVSADKTIPEIQDILDETLVDFSKTRFFMFTGEPGTGGHWQEHDLPDGDWFYEAQGIEIDDFSEFIFPGDVIFEGTAFDEYTEFNGAMFHGLCYFTRSRFNKVVKFENVIFLSDVSFHETEFEGKASFLNTQFGAHNSLSKLSRVTFHEASFKKNVDFEDCVFHGVSSFFSSEFNGRAYFNTTLFLNDVTFRGAVFKKATDFAFASFSKDTVFREVEFNRHVNFSNATFKTDANFEAIKVKGAFNLANTEFALNIPNFTQANFAESPRLDNIEVLPTPSYKQAAYSIEYPKFPIISPLKWQRYWWNLQFLCFLFRSLVRLPKKIFHLILYVCQKYIYGALIYTPIKHLIITTLHSWNKFTNTRRNPDEEAHYRALKRLAIQAHDHENEMKFFAGEIRARRHVTDFANFLTHDFASSMRYWAGVAYELFSDFGRSFIRPIAYWGITFFIFANLTLSNAGLEDKTKCHNSQLTPKEAAYTIGLKNSLLILGLTKTNIVKQAELCLYGVNKNGDAESKPKPYDPKIKRAFQSKPTKTENTKTDIPFKAVVQGITHSLLSLLFIFLLLLAIRNQFKIK